MKINCMLLALLLVGCTATKVKVGDCLVPNKPEGKFDVCKVTEIKEGFLSCNVPLIMTGFREPVQIGVAAALVNRDKIGGEILVAPCDETIIFEKEKL